MDRGDGLRICTGDIVNHDSLNSSDCVGCEVRLTLARCSILVPLLPNNSRFRRVNTYCVLQYVLSATN
jgi:hypothetical protein